MKNKKLIKKRILKEIETCMDYKTKVPPFSIFGGDNRARIQLVIDVLTERLTEDQVYNLVSDIAVEEGWTEDKKWDYAERAGAAARWMAGENEEAPSKNWESLANSKK